jgi:hypothetical protein
MVVLPLGENWDHRGMCCICYFFFSLVYSIDQTCMLMLTLYLCFFANGPRGREAEVIREPA